MNFEFQKIYERSIDFVFFYVPKIIGAILVGIGTQLGNGCTSGHGVCGNALSSRRSILATITFMTTGIVTVLLTKVIGGV